MSGIEGALARLGRLDLLARGDSPVHRLAPRTKLLTSMAFVLCVLSFDRYETTRLLPFFYFPVLCAIVAGLPPGFIAGRVLVVAPFVLLVAGFNPLLDRATLVSFGPWSVAAGWLSFGSILLRFALTVGTVVVLIASTGMARLCQALGRLGLPRPLVVQLLLLYRYLFVLMEEALRMVRAHRLRASGRGIGLAEFRQMAGGLFLRSVARAEHVHCAMRCRGFDGEIRLSGATPAGVYDWLFVVGNCGLFALFRLTAVTDLLGGALLAIRP